MSKLGIAGRLAHTFIDSKLTPLIIAASILLGVGAVAVLPREEEPQIVVPIIDVFVPMPGASAKEVEQRVTYPMERLLWEIPGVEYIYSTSSPGMSFAVVRFEVGEDEEDAIVRLNQKMAANFDLIPPGAERPLIKPRSIDDVPILALTLWSPRYDHFTLRRIAAQLEEEIKQVSHVSEIKLIGGQRRQALVSLDTARMAAYGVSPGAIAARIAESNQLSASGAFSRGDQEFLVETGGFLTTIDEIAGVVVGVFDGRPVYLRNVAEVVDGPEEPVNYVLFGSGPASRFSRTLQAGLDTEPGHLESGEGFHPAVTLSIAKRKGTNAIVVADQVIEKVEAVRNRLIPADVQVTVTRNYGETAAEKSNELLFHMLLAIVSVSILIWLTLGRREAGIVALAIPVTLALTLVVFYFYGYTLNRVTLFALIFSIGILVDDAIVVVENVVRHYRHPGNRDQPLLEVAVEAVDEVGNPTILATFAVIAAILPMAFVRGLMGPYMRPIPMGASAAMIFSLIVAFVVTPWASLRLLRRAPGSHGPTHEKEDWSTTLYRRLMTPMINRAVVRYVFLAGVVGLLLTALLLFAFKLVVVKMLPFDNKSEFQVVIDMPEGSTLERTAALASEAGQYLRTVPEVTDCQIYVGTASPYNFNGLVRHYFLRSMPFQGDLQVNLAPKGERSQQSHEIAKRVRPRLQEIAGRYGASLKVSEVPPGPPVLQTLVAEVYGPDYGRQTELARQIQRIFDQTDGVVDVDSYIEDDQTRDIFEIDKEKAALNGISTRRIADTVGMALGGAEVGLLHVEREREDVPIVLRLPPPQRSDPQALARVRVESPSGVLVPLGEVVRIRAGLNDKSIFHKNLMPVVYVTADVAGREESPVYVIEALNQRIADLELPEGYAVESYTASQPFTSERLAIKWDGEWHITYEVFRDLGIAFAAVLVLIYILVVGWFQSMKTPLVIMAAIPFSLVGILPAHWMLGAFFTATSMIGFIAGAGIVVRNSIILVDFVELRLGQGMPLNQAVVEAGAVRFRPMMLTAAAVVVGASVILFDPIFQGLAISLMAGEVASLLLSRMTVPILYYLAHRDSRG